MEAGEAVGDHRRERRRQEHAAAHLRRADRAPTAARCTVAGGSATARRNPGLFDLLSADEHLALFAPGARHSRARTRSRSGHQLLDEFALPGRRALASTRHLSGGARQKLNLALALLGGAGVLLLDEPYQGFDHGAYVSFWEHVARWKAEGVGVVVVTHLLADTALVDRVVELTIPRGPAGRARVRLRRILVPAEMTGRELTAARLRARPADRAAARVLRRLGRPQRATPS